MSAIEHYELEDPSFRPHTRKFDAYLDGNAQLTVSKMRGKKLFDDRNSGNCASCHIDQPGANGAHPLFTDFQGMGVVIADVRRCGGLPRVSASAGAARTVGGAAAPARFARLVAFCGRVIGSIAGARTIESGL
jgi:cytochrome c peroxidase